ncbi:MAG: winged helix DNA-binding protein [Candidatus Nanopusillus acidilobi]
MIDEILKKKNAARILVKLLSGNVKMTDLKSIVSSYETLRYLIRDLEDLGYVKRREELKDRRIIYVELTEKGRVIAEKLKDIEGSLQEKEEPIAEISKEKYDQMVKDWKRLSALTHINVLDDHIVLKEYNYDGQGHDRLVTIYVMINHDKVMRLYCDVDSSTNCWHVQYAWTLPEVQAWVQYHLQKGDITRTDQEKDKEMSKD